MKPVCIVIMVLLAACTRGNPVSSGYMDTTLFLFSDETLSTRAATPDEDRVSDWNLFIFNSFGDLEEQVYAPGSPTLVHTTRLLREHPYTLVAAANMGYQLPFHSLADARAFRYRLAYPDEYAEGLPMTAVLEDVLITREMPVRLERLMARIDIRIDRRELAPDVLFKVTDISVGNCPSSVSLFPGSGVETASQAFPQGFSLHNMEVAALNRDQADALSESASLYLLENCNQLHESYLEIKAEYHAEDYHTDPGEPLTYRIPLGEVVRNTVYPITVSVHAL